MYTGFDFGFSPAYVMAQVVALMTNGLVIVPALGAMVALSVIPRMIDFVHDLVDAVQDTGQDEDDSFDLGDSPDSDD